MLLTKLAFSTAYHPQTDVLAERMIQTMDEIIRRLLEFQLTEEFSRKHPVFPASLVKPYHKTGEDEFPSRGNNPTPQDIVEVEESSGPVNKIINARKIHLNAKDHRQYVIRFKNQTADKAKWKAEDSIQDGYPHLRRLRASRKASQSHQ
ncbi:hypothetical protein O181_006725 [Austropuccinia psidii MF-1]|uniref:Chromo domain-containing protein n=1 Tax=Austropuccinia psidii MF-1 TaxID=1389203 RepID=A0A9Q3BLJ5_9BASI|nr:hypothetical protein [Austropuccinia psidii MF-1]